MTVCKVDGLAGSSWTAVLLQATHLWPLVRSEAREENGSRHQSHLSAESPGQKHPRVQLLSNHHPSGTAQQEVRYFLFRSMWICISGPFFFTLRGVLIQMKHCNLFIISLSVCHTFSGWFVQIFMYLWCPTLTTWLLMVCTSPRWAPWQKPAIQRRKSNRAWIFSSPSCRSWFFFPPTALKI